MIDARSRSARRGAEELADGRLLDAFTLQVWPAGTPQPFEATVVRAVPRAALGRAAPVSSAPIAFDPRRVVAIDWNRPWKPGSRARPPAGRRRLARLRWPA